MALLQTFETTILSAELDFRAAILSIPNRSFQQPRRTDTPSALIDRLGDVASHLLDTCIPLRLISLSFFARLFEIKPVTQKYESVSRLEIYFRSEFESKWDELRKVRRLSQQGLFETGVGGELNLTSTKN
jgi:hypothetical protein